MTPGEIRTPAGAAPLQANVGLAEIRLVVANTGDRPIQVGSHFHFYEVNKALHFDRALAKGFHLDIPAGLSARFEPGETKEVALAAFGGERLVFGHRGLTNGPVGDETK